jgi:prepilin-type N-terminal cleavage/methylation domain-containing protein
MARHKKIEGVTLVELMIVVAIVAILTGIAVPKYKDLALRAKEGAVLGNLAGLRGAVHIYYADTGYLPQIASDSLPLTPRYTASIPSIDVPFAGGGPSHAVPRGSGVTYSGAEQFNAVVPVVGAYVWGYSSENGVTWVACVHASSRGSAWSAW